MGCQAKHCHSTTFMVGTNMKRKYPYFWICEVCKKRFYSRTGHPRRFCSVPCRAEWNKTLTEEKAPRWSGDSVGREGIHDWLKRNYGRPSVCENPECEGKSKFYDWCKKTGMGYERKRENFLRMCRSCHDKYDGLIYYPSRAKMIASKFSRAST